MNAEHGKAAGLDHGGRGHPNLCCSERRQGARLQSAPLVAAIAEFVSLAAAWALMQPPNYYQLDIGFLWVNLGL